MALAELWLAEVVVLQSDVSMIVFHPMWRMYAIAILAIYDDDNVVALSEHVNK